MKVHQNLYNLFFWEKDRYNPFRNNEERNTYCRVLDILLEETNKQVNEFFKFSSPSLEYDFAVDSWSVFARKDFEIGFSEILDKYGILNSIRKGLSQKVYNEIPKNFDIYGSTIVFRHEFGVNENMFNNYKKIYKNVIAVGKTYSITQFINNELGNSFRSLGALLTENEQLKKQIGRKDPNELKVFKVATYLLECSPLKDHRKYLKKVALVDANNILNKPLTWLPGQLDNKKPSNEILKLVERFEVFEDNQLKSKLKGEKDIDTKKRTILEDLELDQYFLLDIDDFVEKTFNKEPYLIPVIYDRK